MPFSHLHRRRGSLVRPGAYDSDMIYNSNEWHEQAMDFTTYTAIDQTTRLPRLNSTTSMLQDYLRPTEMNKSNSMPAIDMFNPGPFGFSDLINMDSNTVSPLDISSASSVRSESQSGMSTNLASSFRAADNNTLPLLSEKMCPLITGDTDVCEPSRCGPDAPCMNFTHVLPIEECASVPCLQTDATSMASASPLRPSTRASSRFRRPMTTTKRSQTPLSTSSCEERRSVSTTQRQPTTARTSSAPEKPLSKLDKKQRAKQAHSLVEKKYRENLNTKLLLLHTTLQNAQYGPNRFNDAAVNDSDLDLDDDYNDDKSLARGGGRAAGSSNEPTAAAGGSKFRKSEVLDDAMSYVNQTEVEMRHMEEELIRLTERTKALEKALLQSTGGTRSGAAKCGDCSLLKGLGGLQMEIGS